MKRRLRLWVDVRYMESRGEQQGQRSTLHDSFPYKLHAMLDDVETHGLSHIVSWQPHGRCFVVHKRKEFVDSLIPLYFRMSKFSSFQRQLNLYNFNRITTGRDKRGYYHELFIRGRRDLCKNMQRQQVKGTGVRQPSLPENDPNFYLMEYLPPATEATPGQFEIAKAQSTFVYPPPATSSSLPGMLLAFSHPGLQQHTMTAPAASIPNASFQNMPDQSASCFRNQLQEQNEQQRSNNDVLIPPQHYLHALLASLRSTGQYASLVPPDPPAQNTNWASAAVASVPSYQLPPQNHLHHHHQHHQSFQPIPLAAPESLQASGDEVARRGSKLSSLPSFGYKDDFLDEVEGADRLAGLFDDPETMGDHPSRLHHQESDETFEAVMRVLGDDGGRCKT